MVDIQGRKYQVTLPDGRVVSRQYAHQLKNAEKSREYKRKYEATDKAKLRRKRFYENFQSEHGFSYHSYEYNKRKEARYEDKIKE